MRLIKTFNRFFENSVSNISELKSVVMDFIQPLLDDLYKNSELQYDIEVCNYEDRFGEPNTIKLSFYDYYDEEAVEHLIDNRKEVYDFFTDAERLSIHNIKVVDISDLSGWSDNEYGPMVIYIQFIK